MKNIRSSHFVILLYALLFYTCGKQTPISENKSPLTLTKANATEGLSGVYTNNGSDIYFETARISRDKNIVTEHPERDYDIAIRLSDGEGRIISILTEGDDYPESWRVELQPIGENIGMDQKTPELAREAIDPIKKLEVSNDLHQEKLLLIQQMESLGNTETTKDLQISQIREELNKQVAQDMEKLKPSQDINNIGTSTDQLSGGYFAQLIYSFWKPAFYAGSPYHHTATTTSRFYNKNGWWVHVNTMNKCNHGTCPTDPTMSFYTSHYGPATMGPVDPQECPGMWGINHLCNNDTLLEQSSIVNNRQYGPHAENVCKIRMLQRPVY